MPPQSSVLTDAIRRWFQRPAQMVRELFKTEPDEWQVEAMSAFPSSPRLAMKACAGPGKTAVVAWIGWNILLTRPHAFGGAISISAKTLFSTLWPELARWHAKSPLLQEIFEMTGQAIYAKEAPQTWRLEARTWAKDATAEQIGQALAGLHGPYPFWLMDESGGMPESILPICESIFAGNPVEAHIVQAGNPLQRSGPLYRACVRARSLWHVVEITGDPDDPKRSPRIPIDYAREQIAQYGRDNPYVLVRIFGQFPPSSLNALLGPEDISEAQRRSYREHDIAHAPKVLGVDVARFGNDASVIFPRQGLVAFTPLTMRNIDGLQGAGHLLRRWNDWGADAAFIDDTGGYGASWIDQCRQLGRQPIPVQFAGKPHDARYLNKRAEMYWDCAQWIKQGGQLPPCPELMESMPEMTYTFVGDKMVIESKDQLKARIGMSPDHADALVTTFAEPVQPAMAPFEMRMYGAMRRAQQATMDYDPFAGFRGGAAR